MGWVNCTGRYHTEFVTVNRAPVTSSHDLKRGAYPNHAGENAGIQTFVPPTSGRDNDWILVLDDANAGFPVAGTEEFKTTAK